MKQKSLTDSVLHFVSTCRQHSSYHAPHDANHNLLQPPSATMRTNCAHCDSTISSLLPFDFSHLHPDQSFRNVSIESSEERHMPYRLLEQLDENGFPASFVFVYFFTPVLLAIAVNRLLFDLWKFCIHLELNGKAKPSGDKDLANRIVRVAQFGRPWWSSLFCRLIDRSSQSIACFSIDGERAWLGCKAENRALTVQSNWNENKSNTNNRNQLKVYCIKKQSHRKADASFLFALFLTDLGSTEWSINRNRSIYRATKADDPTHTFALCGRSLKCDELSVSGRFHVMSSNQNNII